MRVSEFNGAKGLSTSLNSKVYVEHEHRMDNPRVEELKEWKVRGYRHEEIQSLSVESGLRANQLSKIEDIHSIILTISGRKFFDMAAHVAYIKTENTPLMYEACGNTDCVKKVAEISKGMIIIVLKVLSNHRRLAV